MVSSDRNRQDKHRTWSIRLTVDQSDKHSPNVYGSDRNGMICGYVFRPGERPTSVTSEAVATGLESPTGKLRILRHGVIPDDEIVAIVGEDRCA